MTPASAVAVAEAAGRSGRDRSPRPVRSGRGRVGGQERRPWRIPNSTRAQAIMTTEVDDPNRDVDQSCIARTRPPDVQLPLYGTASGAGDPPIKAFRAVVRRAVPTGHGAIPASRSARTHRSG